jgi:hypothetical protein
MSYYVYLDVTSKLEENFIYYCGKGQKKRISIKSRGIIPIGQKYSFHDNIMKKYGLNRIIVFETDDEKLCFEMESYYIRWLRLNNLSKEYMPTKYATNSTDGGEGISGFHLSDETKQKISN